MAKPSKKPKRDLVSTFEHTEESFDYEDQAYNFENDRGDRLIFDPVVEIPYEMADWGFFKQGLDIAEELE